jgi:hypothetical protein
MSNREIRFNFLMTEDEKRMLEALATADDRSAGAWLRAAIKVAFAEKFGTGWRPKASKH